MALEYLFNGFRWCLKLNSAKLSISWCGLFVFHLFGFASALIRFSIDNSNRAGFLQKDRIGVWAKKCIQQRNTIACGAFSLKIKIKYYD